MNAQWRLGHRRELDGLRGLAIVIVLISHAAAGRDVGRFHAAGASGVTLFFVLSGFLITALLLEEHDSNGRISLVAFYERRARRLLPALFWLLAVFGALMLVEGRPWYAVASIAVYCANWVEASGVSMFPIGHIWSLSVEEQFYVVWPLVLILALRVRRGTLVLVSTGFVASIAATWWLLLTRAPEPRVYFGTEMHVPSLLLGCLLAILASHGLPPIRWRWVMYLSAALLVSSYAVHVGTSRMEVAVAWVASIASVALIWTACSLSSEVFSSGVMRYLGQRSYALYLWHVPLLTLALAVRPGPLAALAAVLASFGLAELSWHVVEKRFILRARHGTAVADGDSTGSRPTSMSSTVDAEYATWR